MTEPTPTPPPSPTPPPTPPPAAPWHAGVDAETLGHWQNKGWKTDDPKEVALAATKQAREAEKYFGVPADQLLKMPKADAKPEDIKAFWGKLGAPAEAKDYDFSGVKFSDGTELEAGFVDTMRGALANAFVPKDKAGAITAAVVKYLEDADKAETATTTAKIAEEKMNLKANWKENYDFNLLKAMEGARRLGLSKDDPAGLAAINALENSMGYARVMEIFRKIGQGTSEDTFIERGATGIGVTTREGAVARKAELMVDKAWADRLLKGGVAERTEWNALNTMIEGAAA